MILETVMMFHEWAKEQPEAIQDWIFNNANDADLS